ECEENNGRYGSGREPFGPAEPPEPPAAGLSRQFWLEPAPDLALIVFWRFGRRDVEPVKKRAHTFQSVPALRARGDMIFELLDFRFFASVVIQRAKLVFSQMIHRAAPVTSPLTAIRIFRTARKMYCLADVSLMFRASLISRMEEPLK